MTLMDLIEQGHKIEKIKYFTMFGKSYEVTGSGISAEYIPFVEYKERGLFW